MTIISINARRENSRSVALTLLCHSDSSRHTFTVQATQTAAELLDQLLDHLAQGEAAERVALLRENYNPVLELLFDGGEIELHDEQTLEDAGVGNAVTCRIAAHPRKEKILFCRYAGQC